MFEVFKQSLAMIMSWFGLVINLCLTIMRFNNQNPIVELDENDEIVRNQANDTDWEDSSSIEAAFEAANILTQVSFPN